MALGYQKVEVGAKQKVKIIYACMVAGQALKAGEVYELPAEDAVAITNMGKAEPAQEAAPPPPPKFVPSAEVKAEAAKAAKEVADQAKTDGKSKDEIKALAKAAFDEVIAKAEADAAKV